MITIYFNVDENNYVGGWGTTQSTNDDIKLILAKDHEFFKSDFSCWKYENDELVFDEEKRQQIITEYESEENKPNDVERLEALENALLELILND